MAAAAAAAGTVSNRESTARAPAARTRGSSWGTRLVDWATHPGCTGMPCLIGWEKQDTENYLREDLGMTQYTVPRANFFSQLTNEFSLVESTTDTGTGLDKLSKKAGKYFDLRQVLKDWGSCIKDFAERDVRDGVLRMIKTIEHEATTTQEIARANFGGIVPAALYGLIVAPIIVALTIVHNAIRMVLGAVFTVLNIVARNPIYLAIIAAALAGIIYGIILLVGATPAIGAGVAAWPWAKIGIGLGIAAGVIVNDLILARLIERRVRSSEPSAAAVREGKPALLPPPTQAAGGGAASRVSTSDSDAAAGAGVGAGTGTATGTDDL